MGGKRIKIDTNLQSKKCAKRYFGDGDWISQLPDEILVDILSLLSLKEAARTAVLSSRWINLWKHTPSLDFAADQSLLDKFYRQEELLETEKPKYVEWVNSVIQSHESLTLKEFRIRFHLNISSKKVITRWLEFAFSRQVKRLELDLRNDCDLSEYYWFPEKFLALSNCTTPKLLPPPNIFKSLKELSFKGIHLGGGVIEFFLHNCPLVEGLVIDQANNISNLEVCGPSLRLKHLEVVHCLSLKSLRVSEPNLTSLKVTKSDGLLLEYVPMLVELSVTFCHYSNDIFVKQLIRGFSCCISQLEVLCLMLVGTLETYELCDFPEMPKLKKLVIKYGRKYFRSIGGAIALLRASPYVEEFSLKYGWIDLPNKDREIKDPITRSPHHHLKLFEFCGYYGHIRDCELISYISDNCVVLEKMIINPVWMMVNGLSEEQTARKNAKEQLEQRVPQHVELVIL